MGFWQWLRVVILGISEGITEWLPISSTGHLMLFSKIFPGDPAVFTDGFQSMFDVIIQLGAILAVITIFFHRLNPVSSYKTKEQKRSTWMLWLKILIAALPAGLVGVIADDWLDAHLGSPYILASMLIVYGVVFIVVEVLRKSKEPTVLKLSEITIKSALFIGISQILALIPGTSRSGVTILTALLLGCSRSVATEFTYFLAIPIMFGASALKFFKYVFIDNLTMSATQWIALFLAMAVAYGVSMLVIRTFLKFIKKHDFTPFGVYRIVFGVVIILIFSLFLS